VVRYTSATPGATGVGTKQGLPRPEQRNPFFAAHIV
jgi:hypothetical protein